MTGKDLRKRKPYRRKGIRQTRMPVHVDNPNGLTEKQLRFCREYACDLNATQAYLTVYGRNNSYTAARKAASDLLTDPRIKEEVLAVRRAYNKSVGLNAKRVLSGLMNIAFADQDLCYDEGADGQLEPKRWSEIPGYVKRAMQGVKVKRRLAKQIGEGGEEGTIRVYTEEVQYIFPDKNAALEKLCKHMGLTKGDVQEALESMVKVVELTRGDGESPVPSHVVDG